MDGEQQRGLDRSGASGTRAEDHRPADRADRGASASTIANMDKYDYMNLLAESRIVDIAWIR